MPPRISPLAELADPLALERCYSDQPEGWDDATLEAAIALQRAEREARLEAKARKATRTKKATKAVEEPTQ